MLIDWFTVAAQVVNFLILVWLLKRFLYRPILNAIDAREKRIAAQVAQAAAARSEAEAQRAKYEASNRELNAEREELMAAARKAANDERAALLQKAREENAKLRERLAAELVEQRDQITRTVGLRLENDLLDTVRRLVTDLSDRDLEEAILDAFVRRLHSLSDADRERLRVALATPGSPISVTLRTAFELSPSQRTAIEAALKEVVPGMGPLRYERASTLIGGAELVAGGYRLDWNMDGYLRDLHRKVDVALSAAAES